MYLPTMVTYKKDITGKTFHNLTVIEFSHLNKTRHSVWKCKCVCGNQTLAQSRLLINGKKKSCGCLKKTPTGTKNPRWKGIGELSRTHYTKIIREAKQRNIPFNVNIEFLWNLYIKQNRKCALSGENIKFRSKVHKADGNASLDRIDSSKGYTEDNVHWVHKDVNVMKWDLSINRFFDLINKIYLKRECERVAHR